jgi:hypothetical protein
MSSSSTPSSEADWLCSYSYSIAETHATREIGDTEGKSKTIYRDGVLVLPYLALHMELTDGSVGNCLGLDSF